MDGFTEYMTPATARVVRLTNVHHYATEEDIRRLFQRYTIIDQIRAINPRVGTNSTVYVLFSTIQDRNAVVANYRHCYIHGRWVNIMPAPTGNYDLNATCEGFVRPEGIGTASAAAKPPSVALDLMGSEFPALGITRKEQKRLRREQYKHDRKARKALSRQNEPRGEERERGDINKREALALVLQRRAMARDHQPRSNPQDRTKKSAVSARLKHRVPSPDLDNPEDPRTRVLLITGIPTEADNDAVMTFFQDYRPESIDRTQIGGNWMHSALVLMQTVEGRDRAVQRMTGRTIQGQRVVVHTFSNLTQEVLDRIMNPGTSSPDVGADFPERSKVARSPVPPPVRATYAPFGSSKRPFIAPPRSESRDANASVPSTPSTSYSPFGSPSPYPAASPDPKSLVIASILRGLNLNQRPSQAHSAQSFDLSSSSTDEKGSSTELSKASQPVSPRRISPGSNRPSPPVSAQPRQPFPQPSWMWTPNRQPAQPVGRSSNNRFGPALPPQGSPRRGRRPPPNMSTTREDTLLEEAMRAEGQILVPAPPRGNTWGRGNQTATGNQGDKTASQDCRNNLQAYLARANRERADEENAAANRVNREAGRRCSPENRSRGAESRGRGRGRGCSHGEGHARGQGDGRGGRGGSRGRGNGTGL